MIRMDRLCRHFVQFPITDCNSTVTIQATANYYSANFDRAVDTRQACISRLKMFFLPSVATE